MCRFIAYLGKPVVPGDVLVKPNNSLINQSIHARELPIQPLNGDGFGFGWYKPDIDDEPAVFKSVKPAWNDTNLTQLASKIRPTCFFAHVRAASKGGVSLANTHPFQHKNLLFMHNGDIGEFTKVKRHLRAKLSDDFYEWIQGQTDSEHFFAFFMEHFYNTHGSFTIEAVKDSVSATIKDLNKLRQEYNVREPAFLNTVISDGKALVATRYISDTSLEARTLYYAAGSLYEYKDNLSQMHPSKDKNEVVLVVSEKLNNHVADWVAVPQNHFLCIDEQLNISQHKIE